MIPLAPGYAPQLVKLDEQMVALGRPLPPVMRLVSMLEKGKRPGLEKWNQACAKWKAELAAWEEKNPEAAIRWHELDIEYAEAEERIEAAKWADATTEYVFERMARLGVPRECIEAVRRPKDTVAVQCARDWFLSGDWCLVLFGGFGTGKTTAAAFQAHQMLGRNYSLQWVRAVAASKGQHFGVAGEVSAYRARSAGLLVVDDIGADHENAGWKGWLEDVLDSRWGNKKRTIITVNTLTLEEFSARMGARLGDRLRTGRTFDCGTGSMRGRETGEEG